MRTEVTDFGRVIVIDELNTNTPQAFRVCVKDAADWEEIHNFIINENEIDDIPNRKIDCISEMPFSEKRSVYNMSVEEADVLRNHPKVEWVVVDSMHNPLVLEQRKLDKEFNPHKFANRFKSNVLNLRSKFKNPTVAGLGITYTQWGLLRHSNSTNTFVGVGTTSTASDVQYSLSGKNVDVVIMDTGVRWDHPDFLKPGYESWTYASTGIATEQASRVRDILIHGQEEYGINWSANGLIAPGTSTLAGYAKTSALNDNSFNGSWHGTHVAGTAAGNQFGVAFEANIWSIACIDRDDVGFSDPSDGFDYIRVWHKNKPINPETGRKNPTIVNGSWGFSQFVYRGNIITFPYTVIFRGKSHTSANVDASSTYLPPVFNIDKSNSYYNFTSKHATSQTTCDELFDDPLCRDVIVVLAAGNSGQPSGKQDIPGGVDYDNQFTTALYYYSTGISGSSYSYSGYGTVDPYYNRPGTPAITHIGQSDAPIVVGALDCEFEISSTGITSERKADFSNTGPAIDVWSAGSQVLSPYSNEDLTAYGYVPAISDPRNSSFYNQYLSGTSMASPNVTGVLAAYLQSQPSATRVDVREWLYRHGSVVLENGPGKPILDTYKNVDQVGAGTSVNYWSDTYGLKGATARILINPFANNAVFSFRQV